MTENESNIDKLTAGWLKQMNPEDPSSGFSGKVMQSIYALKGEKDPGKHNYWWFLLLIPIFAAGGWYISTIPAYAIRINDIIHTITEYYYSMNASFGEIFTRIKSISISPLLILGFLALLSLLLIEDIFRKSRNTKLPAEGHA